MGFFGGLTAVTGITQTALGYVNGGLAGIGLFQYRPEVWSEPNYKPLVMITVPGAPVVGPSSSSLSQQDNGNISVNVSAQVTQSAPTSYVFDSYPRVEHELTSVVTKNPSQSGSPISGSVYLEPRRVVVELICSDALQSYFPNQFALGPVSGSDPFLALTSSKSVNAFLVLKSLRENRTAVSLVTRLDSYDNMVITSIRAPDDGDTQHGLRAVVVFEEVFYASISTQVLSQRPDTLDTTFLGEQGTSTPTDALIQQHTVTSLPVDSYAIPGGGDLSSDVIGS